eukprot:g35193.t1
MFQQLLVKYTVCASTKMAMFQGLRKVVLTEVKEDGHQSGQLPISVQGTNYVKATQKSEVHWCYRLRISLDTVTELCYQQEQNLWPDGVGGHPILVAVIVTATLNFTVTWFFQGSFLESPGEEKPIWSTKCLLGKETAILTWSGLHVTPDPQ